MGWLGFLRKASDELGPGDLVVEFIRKAANTTVVIYGKDHASAGADDCQRIRYIVGVVDQQEGTTAGTSVSSVAITSDESANDTVTITQTGGTATADHFVMVVGLATII